MIEPSPPLNGIDHDENCLSMKRPRHSIYPTPPAGSQVLVSIPGNNLSAFDRAVVAISSSLIVGSVAWVPLLFAWAYKRWKKIPKSETRRRLVYGSLMMACISIKLVGPHRNPKVGEWLQARNWSMWKSWLRFLAFEVVADTPKAANALKNEQAVLAVSPHGLFPFALAFAALPDEASTAFGYFQPIVATATNAFPFVNTFLKWLRSVDAGRASVDRALSQGARIGLAPGGISEMFEGYPKPGTHPNEEYAITRHKGFLKLAVKHGLPVVPIYCFGATKMLRRLQLPAFFEKISKLLRISIVIMYGVWGLPVPFRQRLLYTMGEPIYPRHITEGQTAPLQGDAEFRLQVDEMHFKFCESLANMFERHKESYGWADKALKLV